MKGTGASAPGSSAIVTVPNAISAARIALIPVFFTLIVHTPTTTAGVILFGFVVATAVIAVLVNDVEKERTRAVVPAE